MDEQWHDYDAGLTEAEKYLIYMSLPIDMGEDSPSVEIFLEEVWARPLRSQDLLEFCMQYRAWVVRQEWYGK